MFQIELENGDCVNLKGFSNSEKKNSIHNHVFTFANFFLLMPYHYFRRIGNLFFFITNIACLIILKNLDDSITPNFDQIEYFLIFYNPLFWTFAVLSIKLLYFDSYIKQEDKIINSKQVTIFTRFRKIIKYNQLLNDNDLHDKLKKEAIMAGKPLNQPQPIKREKINDFQMKKQLIDDRENDKKPEKIVNSRAKLAPSSSGLKQKLSSISQNAYLEGRIQLFSTIHWEELRVGDIVFLKKNEICPADLLILEQSDINAHVTSAIISGNTNEMRKQANHLTHYLVNNEHQFKRNPLDYRTILTGIVRYGLNSKKNNAAGYYRGFIKLKKDPQAGEFRKENIMYREQILTNIEYIYGLVLFTGKNCKCYQNMTIKKSKDQFFNHKTNIFFIISFINVLFLALVINFFQQFQLSWFVQEIQQYNQIKTLVNHQFHVKLFFYFLLYYVNTLPIQFYLVIDLIQLINSAIQSKQFQKELLSNTGTNKQLDFTEKLLKINEPYLQQSQQSMTDLTLIDFIIFDKTMTLTIPSFKIRNIIIQDKSFYINNKIFKQADQWDLFKKEVYTAFQQNQSSNIFESIISEVEDSKSPEVSVKRRNQTRHTYAQNLDLRKKSAQRQRRTTEIVFKYNKSEIEKNFLPIQEEFENANLQFDDINETHCQYTQKYLTNIPKAFNKIDDQNYQQDGLQLSSQDECCILMDRRPSQISNKINLSYKVSENRSRKQNKKQNEQLAAEKKSYQNNKFASIADVKEEQSFEDSNDEKSLFRQLIMNEEINTTLEEAFFVLALCHVTKTKFKKKSKIFAQNYAFELDRLQIELAKEYDFEFVCGYQEKQIWHYIVQHKSNLVEFKIKGIHIFNSKRLSLIIEIPEKNKYEFLNIENDNEDQDPFTHIQYIRDDGLDLVDCLQMNKEENEMWDDMIRQLYMKGCRPVLFYKNFMTSQEAESFIEQANQIILQKEKAEDENSLKILVKQIQKNFELVQIIGLQEKIQKGVIETIQLLKKAELQLWIASGDSYEKVLPVAYFTEILNDKILIVNFNSPDTDYISSTIKQQIQTIHNQLKQQEDQEVENNSKLKGGLLNRKISRRMSSLNTLGNLSFSQKIKSFSILISGIALEQIYKDSYFLNHFSFLVYLSNQLIGYEMNPSQKQILVKILHKKYSEPNRVLVVGDSFNDKLLFHSADYSIQIISKRIKAENNLKISDITQEKQKEQNPKSSENIDQNKSEKLYLENQKQSLFLQLIKILEISNEHVPFQPNADIILNKFQNLIQLIFYESRIKAEVYDHLLCYSFYRSYLFLYVIFLWNCLSYSSSKQILTPLHLAYYQWVYFAISASIMTYCKIRIKIFQMSGIKILSEQYQSNTLQFKKKKILLFLYKINLNSLIESIIIVYFCFTYGENLGNQTTGKQIDLKITENLVFILLMFVELFKLFQKRYIIYVAMIYNLILYVISYILLTISTIYYYDYNIAQFEYSFEIFNNSQCFFLGTFIILITKMVDFLADQIIYSFFIPSIISDQEEYASIISKRFQYNFKEFLKLSKQFDIDKGRDNNPYRRGCNSWPDESFRNMKISIYQSNKVFI